MASQMCQMVAVFPRQTPHRFRRHPRLVGIGEPTRLIRDRFGDAHDAVANIDDTCSRTAVEVAAPVTRVEIDPIAVIDVQEVLAHVTGEGVVAACLRSSPATR